MAETFGVYNAADYLRTEADIMAYFEAAAEDGDPGVMGSALGVVAQARMISQLERETGLAAEEIRKAFSIGGGASWTTLATITVALGLDLSNEPMRDASLHPIAVRAAS